MASSISWLDASSEEQKRMREILGLFSDKESREELGLGQIRDALGDGLFPGTSTLHTRARYMLFSPWIFQQISARRGTLEDARKLELTLVNTLRDQGSRNEGIIGYEAGSALQTMPSTIYWSALSTYGILQNPNLNREQALSLHGAHAATELEELGEATLRAWHAGIPEAPEGFPNEVPEGMELTFEEADWLRERIIYSQPESMLAHLAAQPSLTESAVPWEEPAALAATGERARILHHAQRFSEVIHGAQLLYNLLIAESYEAAGFTKIENPAESFTQRYGEWAQQFVDNQPATDWDIEDFFLVITKIRGSRLGASSEAFVRDWVKILDGADPRTFTTSSAAGDLVRKRESRNKGAMARIGNKKRLETWGGSSGAGRYVYRWSYVKTILGDIQTALATGPTGETPQDRTEPAEILEVAQHA